MKGVGHKSPVGHTNYLDVRTVLISEQIAEPRREKQNLATTGDGRKHV